MTTTEIFSSFTQSQRREFDSSLQQMIIDFSAECLPGGEYEISSHCRLEDTVFLYLTVIFTVSKEGKVKGEIKSLKKFDSKEQYFESAEQEKSQNNQ